MTCSPSAQSNRKQQHGKSCSETTSATCPHCDATADITRANLQSHIDDACPETVVSCTHSRFGCEWTGKRKDLRNEHLDLDCAFEPLKTLLHHNERRMASLEEALRTVTDAYTNLVSHVEGTEGRSDPRRRTRQRPPRARSPRSIVLATDDNSLSDIEGLEHEDSTTHHHQRLEQMLERVSGTVEALSNRVSTLEQDARESRAHCDQFHEEARLDVDALRLVAHDLRGEMMMAIQTQRFNEESRRSWFELQRARSPLRRSGVGGNNSEGEDGSGSENEGSSLSSTNDRVNAPPLLSHVLSSFNANVSSAPQPHAGMMTMMAGVPGSNNNPPYFVPGSYNQMGWAAGHHHHHHHPGPPYPGGPQFAVGGGYGMVLPPSARGMHGGWPYSVGPTVPPPEGLYMPRGTTKL